MCLSVLWIKHYECALSDATWRDRWDAYPGSKQPQKGVTVDFWIGVSPTQSGINLRLQRDNIPVSLFSRLQWYLFCHWEKEKRKKTLETANPVKSIMNRDTLFSPHTNFHLAFITILTVFHRWASWPGNFKVTSCWKYPWMTPSGVKNPPGTWRITSSGGKPATRSKPQWRSLLSASGAFELISQRIFHIRLGQSLLCKTGNSQGRRRMMMMEGGKGVGEEEVGVEG